MASLLLWLAGFPKRRVFCLQERVAVTVGSNFRTRPSTSVLLKIESFLYPESYCYLGHSRIHFVFDQEDFLDGFRTPHYPALFHAAAAHCSLDYGSRGW